MPKVSIIMSVYNAEQTIRQAIDSIINQTFEDWEFVICDDCSTDRTLEIIKDYKNKFGDKFVIIQNEKNSKLAFSLNHCLEFSSGEYIARMDADDESLPERLEKQVKFLDEHPKIAVVGTSMLRFNEDGDYAKVLSDIDPKKESLKMDVPHFHATIMMRKSVYDDVGGYTVLPRTERGQDLDLWFKVYSKGYKGANLQDYLYRVREDPKAFKRRKLKYDVYFMKTRLNGYRMLNAPLSWYPYAASSVIGHFVPRSLKILRRNLLAKKYENSKENN